MRKSKYHARKVLVGGQKFDSQREAARWQELLLLQRAGKISGLRRQVPFLLIPAQRRTTWDPSKKEFITRCVERKCTYIADFVYTEAATGKEVVEDAKGVKTPEYIIKRKLMLERLNIRVKEV